MKSFFNKNLLIDFLVGIFAGVLIFFKILSKRKDFELSFYISLGGLVLCTIILSLLRKVKKKQHRSILDTKKLKIIKTYFQLQLETRNQGQYWGYKGYYKGYFIRISYDSIGDCLNVLIYYKQPQNEMGEIDFNLLNELNKKYSKFQKQKRTFDTSHIRMFISGINLWKPKLTITSIEASIDLLIKMNLKTTTEDQIEYLLKNDKYMHEPWIDTFQ